jgi:hypothetical protein
MTTNTDFSIYNYDGEQVSRVFEGDRKAVQTAWESLKSLLPKAEFAESAIIFNSVDQKEIKLIGTTGYPVFFTANTESIYSLAHHCDNELDIMIGDDDSEGVQYMHEIPYHVISIDENGELRSQRQDEADHPEDFDENFYHFKQTSRNTQFKPGDSIVEIWTYYDNTCQVVLLRSDFTGEDEVWG